MTDIPNPLASGLAGAQAREAAALIANKAYADTATIEIVPVSAALAILARPEVVQALADLEALAPQFASPISAGARYIASLVAQDRATQRGLTQQAEMMQAAIDRQAQLDAAAG